MKETHVAGIGGPCQSSGAVTDLRSLRNTVPMLDFTEEIHTEEEEAEAEAEWPTWVATKISKQIYSL
jgi:hypothetical protein